MATLQSVSPSSPPASSCLDERQERQMGSVITGDYISGKKPANMKGSLETNAKSSESNELSLISLLRRTIGVLPESEGNGKETKVYANQKICLRFICHSCGRGFFMRSGRKQLFCNSIYKRFGGNHCGDVHVSMKINCSTDLLPKVLSFSPSAW